MLFELNKELRDLRSEGQSDLSITVLVADRGDPAHLDHLGFLSVRAVMFDMPDIAVEQVFLSVSQLLIGRGWVQSELFGKVHSRDPDGLSRQGDRLGRQLRDCHGYQPLLTKVQTMRRAYQRVVHRNIAADGQLHDGSIFARSGHCETFRVYARIKIALAYTRNVSQ